MNRPRGEDHWSAYWAQRDNARTRGCLPNAAGSVDQAQERWWQQFAATLPRKARVLDLGTGNGFVLRKLQAARPDLKLIGVDSATVLPPAPERIQLRAGVAIEDLPFGECSFDAVVSQFGYEYADTGRGAGEIARVLGPGGKLSMIVHHRGGPIVCHNLARRDGIRWILKDRKLLDDAVRFASARQMLDLPVPPNFLRMLEEARALPAPQAVAAEIVQAVLQMLVARRASPPAEVVTGMRRIEAMALDESSRIDALEHAARSDDGINALADELRTAGLSVEAPGTVSESPGAHPFAWLINARS